MDPPATTPSGAHDHYGVPCTVPGCRAAPTFTPGEAPLHGAPYTADDDALILAPDGLVDRQIAAQLGRNIRSVRARRAYLRGRSDTPRSEITAADPHPRYPSDTPPPPVV
jgi:hypothetical protein